MKIKPIKELCNASLTRALHAQKNLKKLNEEEALPKAEFHIAQAITHLLTAKIILMKGDKNDR